MTLEEVITKGAAISSSDPAMISAGTVRHIANAVRAFLLSDEVVRRAADAICGARCDAGRPDPGKGLDEFIARAALSSITGDE